MGDVGLLEPGGVSSAESTPASTPDEERCLTAPAAAKSAHYQQKQHWTTLLMSFIPWYMILITTVQICMWLWCDARINRLLRWEPSRRTQLWRCITYTLLHRDGAHLALNVLLQLLLCAPLQREQGGARASAVYAGGGVAGALGAALTQPQPLVGASAGVYALLISHLAHLFLNLPTLKYRKYRVFCVCVLATSDAAFCILHARAASISVGAHGAGGVAGALLGLAVYHGEGHRYTRIAAAVSSVLVFLAAFIAVGILPESYFKTI